MSNIYFRNRGNNTMSELDRLKEIVETLRRANGCPWARAQLIYL